MGQLIHLQSNNSRPEPTWAEMQPLIPSDWDGYCPQCGWQHTVSRGMGGVRNAVFVPESPFMGALGQWAPIRFEGFMCADCSAEANTKGTD